MKIEENKGQFCGEAVVLAAEFKLSLNSYLKNLVVSPVRSLADVIAFNQKNADLEKINEFGQDIFLLAQTTNGISATARLSREGFEKLVSDYKLDALVTPSSSVAPLLAIGGFPGINVFAGYDSKDVSFGINFGGLQGSESKLIGIVYGFEESPFQFNLQEQDH
ncbi:probable amidase At4g34880 [Arachis hypogaea]|uniref:probable amidase At4g34880 n=1 Tax=Arachis hypogaea TaxID=3818 RepID=UPI003B220D07